MSVNRGHPSFYAGYRRPSTDELLRRQAMGRQHEAAAAAAEARARHPDVIDMVEVNGVWMTPEDAALR